MKCGSYGDSTSSIIEYSTHVEMIDLLRSIIFPMRGPITLTHSGRKPFWNQFYAVRHNQINDHTLHTYNYETNLDDWNDKEE